MPPRAELLKALSSHDERRKAPWGGPYHFRPENEAIGDARAKADAMIRAAGMWPAGVLAIGNGRCLALLNNIETKGAGL